MKYLLSVSLFLLAFDSFGQVIDPKTDSAVNVTFVKRVVQLPKDTIRIHDSIPYPVPFPVHDTVKIYVPYAVHDTVCYCPPKDTIVIPPPPVQPFSVEGFGKDAIGGEGKQIVIVTTVAQFNAAVKSNTYVKFGANLSFKARIDLSGSSAVSYMTIDANGFDVSIDNNNNGDGISIGSGSHHVVIKGIRVTNAGNDGINVIDGAHDVLIDHCTSYGNRDGNIDIAATSTGQTKNVTVQYCIIGDNQGSGKTLVTGQNVSLHHNLYVSTSTGANASTTEGKERNPFIHSNYSAVGNPNCDFRNNVIVSWGRYGSGIGYKATGNFVNNYYGTNKVGAIDPNADPSGNTGKYYVAGNVQLGGANINLGGGNHAEYLIADPYKITMTDANTAAKDVKAKAGTPIKNAYEQTLISSIQIN